MPKTKQRKGHTQKVKQRNEKIAQQKKAFQKKVMKIISDSQSEVTLPQIEESKELSEFQSILNQELNTPVQDLYSK